jgi:hypothetical protein
MARGETMYLSDDEKGPDMGSVRLLSAQEVVDSGDAWIGPFMSTPCRVGEWMAGLTAAELAERMKKLSGDKWTHVLRSEVVDLRIRLAGMTVSR